GDLGCDRHAPAWQAEHQRRAIRDRRQPLAELLAGIDSVEKLRLSGATLQESLHGRPLPSGSVRCRFPTCRRIGTIATPRDTIAGVGTFRSPRTGGSTVRSVCVFCASNVGSDPVYSDVARDLASAIAARGIRLVYGGGHVGLMGVIADTALAAGGEVIGVMPRSLVEKEIAHTGLTELHITESMHERKATMERLSEGFIALPGGFGTLDEFC